MIKFLLTNFLSFQAGDFLRGLPSFNKENFTRFNADGVQAKSIVSVTATVDSVVLLAHDNL